MRNPAYYSNASPHSLPMDRSLGYGSSLTFRISIWLVVICLGGLILNPIFGTYAALIFIAGGGLLIATRPAESIVTIVRYWYLLLLPMFCLLSVLWSQYPSVSLRHGIQFVLTFLIAIVVANRVSAKEFVRILFAIYSVGIVLSLLIGEVRQDIGAWIGIFNSKNAFAAFVAVYALLCIAMFTDRTLPVWFRLSVLGGCLLCIPLLILAQSVGAILMTIPAVLLAVSLYLARRFRAAHKIFLFCVLLLVGASALIVFSAFGDAIFASLLERSGKDPNLTGRTDLWRFGRYTIQENFWLGVGYQAFWVKGFGPAEAFWAMFNITGRSGFNFHNTYISNAVEIGVVGVALQVLMLYGALILCTISAIKSKSSEMIFFASFLTFVALASFVEVAIFFQFSVTSIVVVCALIYGVKGMANPAASKARRG